MKWLLDLWEAASMSETQKIDIFWFEQTVHYHERNRWSQYCSSALDLLLLTLAVKLNIYWHCFSLFAWKEHHPWFARFGIDDTL